MTYPTFVLLLNSLELISFEDWVVVEAIFKVVIPKICTWGVKWLSLIVGGHGGDQRYVRKYVFAEVFLRKLAK